MKPLLTALLIFAFNFILAQNVNFIHYTTNNSKLPHDIVYRLRQDKAGFIWISTDDGLVRFDGSEMVNFDKGFVSKYVIGTDEENDKIWACTWKGGIHLIKKDSAVLISSKGLQGSSFAYSTNDILVFNNLVIAHSFKDYMVFSYDSVQNILNPISLKQTKDTNYLVQPGNSEYYRFFKTSKHKLYAFNHRGLYEIIDGKFKRIPTLIQPDNIWESPTGILYFQQGINIYSASPDFSKSRLVFRVPHTLFGNKNLISFRILPSGNVCLGFESPELHNSNPVYYLLNTRTGEVVDFSREIVGEVLSADLMIDKEGGIWFSSDGRGLFHVFDVKYKQIGGDKIFNNSSITDLCLLGSDSMFIGTKEGLYLYHNNSTELIKLPNVKPNLPVKNLFLTPQNKLVISFNGNLGLPGIELHFDRIYQLPLSEIKTLKGYVFSVYVNGQFKLTNRDGSVDYTKQIKLVQPFSDLVETDKGELWLAAGTSLSKFKPDSGQIKWYEPALENVLINCLCFVKDQGLWLGTNSGLFLIPPDGKIKHWGLEEGLLNQNVRCIYSKSPTSLWLGTQNGLHNFNTHKFTIYKRRDGLIADDVTCIAPLNKTELVVGSSKGITLFTENPGIMVTPPLISIEKLTVNGAEKNWNNKVEIPFNSVIFIKYRSITFIYPELLNFEYRLHENEDWISTQNNSLVFTNLKPGEYNFEIRVKKYNSDYSKPVSIRFTTLSPWWKSVYFYSILFIFCVTIIYFFLKFELNKQKKKAVAKQEIAELRMKALQAQLNPHFISNALNAIQYYILKQDELAANIYLGKFTDLTRLFLEVSRNRFVTLETELEVVKNYLDLEKLRFENRFDFSIEIEPEIDTHTTYIPGLLMQPFIENSINHGIVYLPKNRMGLISIKIQKFSDFIKITINDNGIGRLKAKEIKNRLPKSYRSHSSQILEELKDTYNLLPGCEIDLDTFDKENNNNESLGTCVYIKVKLNKNITLSH